MARARTKKSVLGDNPFATPPGTAQDDGTAPPPPADDVAPRPEQDPKPAIPPESKRSSAAPASEHAPTQPAPRSNAPPPRTPTPPARATTKNKPVRLAAVGETVAGKVDGEIIADPLRTGRKPRANARLTSQIAELERSTDRSEIGTTPTQHVGGGPGSADAGAPKQTDASDREDGGMIDAARELLSTTYYFRQWGRIGMRSRSEEVDDFGHDPKYDARWQPLLDLLYERYFRVSAEGVENIPAEGRALVVVNHAGTFPYDSLILKTAIRREHQTHRDIRWLAEDHLFYMPFVGSFLNRMGAVRACQQNAERLLRHERLVAVFPEGAKGTGRLFRDRHRLQRFGRGGFVRLCLRTRTPIIPCVIVGPEEAMPLLFRVEYLANLLGLPYIPITPTFPALGPLGVVPAPTKWQFVFGDPIHFEGHGPDHADDHVLVGRLTERVRATMQAMLDRTVSARRSPWFG